ncbi:MAG: ribonuclease HII [Candidatus Omnitrophica bacterium]|nr:ribonuclease HII [Candidatus Omnitrophota bacterium]
MLYYERALRRKGYTVIIGVDEAGRGPLAGPVVAAAVALTAARFSCRIDDSKALTARQRIRAYQEIIGKSVFGVGIVGEKDIDRFNIRRATRMAMEKAVDSFRARFARAERLCPHLFSSPHKMHIIVDGDMAIETGIACKPVVRGDTKSRSIACASILAKVLRDGIMVAYHGMYPRYGFIRNKGYPTREHRLSIKRYGLSPVHRRSFCSCAQKTYQSDKTQSSEPLLI